MRVGLVIVAIAFALGAAPASAQETGGSFGAGNWGGGAASPSSRSSSSSSSSSTPASPGPVPHPTQPTTASQSTSSGEGLGLTGTLLIVGIGLVVFAGIPALLTWGPPWKWPVVKRLLPAPRFHVSALTLGIDWRARRHLQSRLAELAKTSRADRRAYLVKETTVELRRAAHAWLYAGYREDTIRGNAARTCIERWTSDARARFRRELVRGEDGRITTDEAPAITPRAEEGDGVVVITLLVAVKAKAKHNTPPVRTIRGEVIEQALGARGTLSASELTALEVVWSPAADEDRMSTLELAELYPELQLIDPASIAGRAVCDHCRGRFPKELLSCPHCGAKVTVPAA